MLFICGLWVKTERINNLHLFTSSVVKERQYSNSLDVLLNSVVYWIKFNQYLDMALCNLLIASSYKTLLAPLIISTNTFKCVMFVNGAGINKFCSLCFVQKSLAVKMVILHRFKKHFWKKFGEVAEWSIAWCRKPVCCEAPRVKIYLSAELIWI